MNRWVNIGIALPCLSVLLIAGQPGAPERVAPGTAGDAAPVLRAGGDEERLREAQRLLDESSALFIENRGQIRDSKGEVRHDIAYTAALGGTRLFFRPEGISYVLITPAPREDRRAATDATPARSVSCRVDMIFPGSAPTIGAELPAEEEHNYYMNGAGIDGVKGYGRLLYENLYEGIDLAVTTAEGRIAYAFVVRPGADLSAIAIRFDGAEAVTLDGRACAHVRTALGDIVLGPASMATGEAIARSLPATGATAVAPVLTLDGGTFRLSAPDADRAGTIVLAMTSLTAAPEQSVSAAPARTKLYRDGK